MILKRFLIIAILTALALITLPRLFKRQPALALVNAPMVELRAPVEAVVSKRGAEPSGFYEELPQEVVQLRSRQADQLAALQAQEVMLTERLQQFVGNERQRLKLELAAREGDQRRAELNLAADTQEFKRQESLTAQGFISPAKLDNVTLVFENAKVERAIAQLNTDRAKMNLQALTQNGFLSERAGGLDVSYTQQRLDEVRLRIHELKAWASSVYGADMTTLGHAGIRTPGQGLLMGLQVAEGAFLAPGDLIAHYVLCKQAFIDLRVPVIDLPDYQVGSPLSFRVNGEWRFYTGKITQVQPRHVSGAPLALAIAPNERELESMARVRVQPESEFTQRIERGSNCMMGQTVHAQLPTAPGWVPRWTSFLADVF